MKKKNNKLDDLILNFTRTANKTNGYQQLVFDLFKKKQPKSNKKVKMKNPPKPRRKVIRRRKEKEEEEPDYIPSHELTHRKTQIFR